jgi:hypothetical protein
VSDAARSKAARIRAAAEERKARAAAEADVTGNNA